MNVYAAVGYLIETFSTLCCYFRLRYNYDSKHRVTLESPGRPSDNCASERDRRPKSNSVQLLSYLTDLDPVTGVKLRQLGSDIGLSIYA